MQLAVDVSVPNVIDLISQMSLNEVEEVKNKIIEKELYFKKFKKEDYLNDFLKDSEDGLKNSSIYNAN